MFLRAYLFLVTTALCWGANAIAGRLAVGHISPFLLTSARWGLAMAAAAALGAPHLRRDWPAIRRNLPLLFAFGTVGFTCFNAAYYTAAAYTTALNIVIIQAGMPLIIFALNFALFRSAVSGAQALGFLLTLTGVAATVSNGSLATLLHLQFNRGDALMLLAILFYGGYTAALRWKPRMHWLSFMAAIAGGAFVASLPLTGWEIASGRVLWPDAQGVGVAVFAALFPGLIAQASFIAGTELIGSNRAGLFVNLVPVFGAIMSVLILGEQLRVYHLVGLGLVLSGVAMAERKRRVATPPRSAP
ncbi:DMT family transporter [Acidimangrovimonas pyrenivorans]|uniref:DMT family transporter n=1 Tax=Acidimangrovimonas pyrenivorans TaxID=2030798 RepID=A0ABV7AHE5_9RHOB